MATMEEKTRLEYAALMGKAQDAERMAFSSWMATGIAAMVLLAWGMGSRQPGSMVPVVMVAAAGFLAMIRSREQASSIAGYIEAHYESEDENPSYYTLLGRMRGTVGHGNSRDWHATAFFNAIGVVAAVFAWMWASNGDRGELWAGVVTGCMLAFGSYSLSETGRMQQADPAADWRRAEGGLHEVKRRGAR
jgi:hypothetical protein